MKTTTRIAARLMSLCIATGIAYTASAGDSITTASVGDQTLRYTVRFADLDLSSVEGANALYSRIRHAARLVCDPENSRELSIAAQYRICVATAINEAVATVDRPVLSQLHHSQGSGTSDVSPRLAKAN